MIQPKQFSRGPSSYKRGNPRVPSSGKSFLIVTEGKKTEPNYVKLLRDRLQLSMTDVEIVHPEGTDPLTLVRKAVELRDIRQSEAKNGSALVYDEVWVVFDLEKPHDERRELAKKAMKIKGSAGIKYAISDPCFEYWLLIHWEYTTSPFRDCKSVTKRLKKYWPGYSKGATPPVESLEKLPSAVAYAKRCRDHHKAAGGDGNPSTMMDNLVCALNAATRQHLRFPIGKGTLR